MTDYEKYAKKALENGIKYKVFYQRVRRSGWSLERAATTPVRKRKGKYGEYEENLEYALYKGDDLLTMGTKQEIAEEYGIRVETLDYYLSPSYKRRTKKLKNHRVLVRI